MIADLLFRIFPAACPGCGTVSRSGTPGTLCPECLAKLRFFDPALRCPGCGAENTGTLSLCPQCLAEKPRPWLAALALFPHTGFGRQLIHKFKFADTPELARPFAALAAPLLDELPRPPDLIIPIPLQPIRAIRRSYNQSALLAELIAHARGIPLSTALKRRIAFTHQSALGRRERHTTLKNAFRIAGHPDLAGKHILLVDDVMTTGSTLDAAARLLLASGADSLSILVIARALCRSPRSLAGNR